MCRSVQVKRPSTTDTSSALPHAGQRSRVDTEASRIVDPHQPSLLVGLLQPSFTREYDSVSPLPPHHLQSPSALAALSGFRGVYGGGEPYICASYSLTRFVVGCHVLNASFDFILLARSLRALLRCERTQSRETMPKIKMATKMIMPVMTRRCMPHDAS
jgi:hypothetical protein